MPILSLLSPGPTLHYIISRESYGVVAHILLPFINDGFSPSIASSLAPEDPEIAFNLAAVLEACESHISFYYPQTSPSFHQTPVLKLPTLNINLFTIEIFLIIGGRLEEALTHYKRSKEFGVERAEMHIRNVS